MLNYSFSTVWMAVLTGNLIIVLTALCLRYKNILLSVGYRVLMVFSFLTLVRFVLLFELPAAKNIYFPKFLSVPLAYFRYPLLKLPWMSVSLWTIFEAVWLAGILHHLRRHLLQHSSLLRQVAIYSVDVTEQNPYAAILADVCGKRKNSFRLLKVYGIATPSIFGILKPRILIPAKMQLTEENLYHVFRHEASHHYHHDIWVKCFVSILTILYWWNPFCRIFKRQIDQLLEMRVDDSLTNKDPATVRSYLRTLLYIKQESVRLQLSANLYSRTETFADYNCITSEHSAMWYRKWQMNMLTSIALPENFLLSFSKSENSSPLTRRFEMLCNGKKNSRAPLTILLFVLVCSMYLGSYLVTFETSHTIENVSSSEHYSGNISTYNQ